MANITKYSFGLILAASSAVSVSANAAPLFFDQINPDTVVSRVFTTYDATTNQFVQRGQFSGELAGGDTTAFYRQDEFSGGDAVDNLGWSLSLTVDENGDYTAKDGVFELFGSVDFADPSKTDLVVPQVLVSGAIEAFGITQTQSITDIGFGQTVISNIGYNILGRALYSAEGIDYAGYLGMLWTDNISTLSDGSARDTNQKIFGSDFQSNATGAEADIFVVPAPSSLMLFGLALVGMVRAKRQAKIS